MSADINTGASIALVITDIYSTIQKIQSIYDDYNNRLGGKLTIKHFHQVIDPSYDIAKGSGPPERHPAPPGFTHAEIDNDRKIITKMICNIGANLKNSEDATKKLFNAQVSGVKITKGIVTFLYVVFLVIIMITLMYSVKDYISVDNLEVVKITLIFILVFIVFTSLYQMFMLFLNNQMKQITSFHKQNRNRIEMYKQFIFGQDQEMSTKKNDDKQDTSKQPVQENKEDTGMMRKQAVPDDKGLLKMMAAYHAIMESKNPKVSKKQKGTFDKSELFNEQNAKNEKNARNYFTGLAEGNEEITKDFWSNHLSLVASNIHVGGTGLAALAAIDEKSDNFRILRSTNDILDNFYQLLLRSYNALDTDKSDKAKKAVIDNIVIKQLLGTNIFALENQISLSDEDLQNKLEAGDHYHVLLLGFKYSIIYMYAVWRNVSPNSLVNLTADNPDKEKISDFLSRDPAFEYVLKSYPLNRANYEDVLAQIDLYGKSVSTTDAKKTWDDFLTLSTSEFKDVTDTYTVKYMEKMNSATTDKATQYVFAEFATHFLPYFDKLYDNVLNNELAVLNPEPHQYIIYDKVFMRERLEALFTDNDMMQLMDASYRDFILNLLMGRIVQNQQTRLQSTVLNVNDPSNTVKNLQTAIINKAINDTVMRIASQLSSFNIKTEDYTEYILAKLFQSNAKSEMIVLAIKNALLQIDFQTALTKKTSPSLSKEDDRFVSPETFIQSINEMRWTTFKQSLRVNELNAVVNSLRTDEIDMFNDDEYNLKIARSLYTTSIFLGIFGFILYFLMTHDPRKHVSLRGGFIEKMVNKLKAATRGATKTVEDASKASVAATDRQYNSTLQLLSSEFLKVGVPFSLLVLFLSVFHSYIQKADTNIEFNKNQVTRNTNGLKTSIGDLKDFLLKLEGKLGLKDKNASISDIAVITEEEKTKLYVDMRNIVSTYDKCNYIIGAGRNTLPFPYAEVISDGFMVALITGSLIYVLMKFSPVERLSELKDLFEYKETSETLSSDVSFMKEIAGKFSCHKDTVESIIMSVKLLTAISIVVFVLVYSIRVNTSTKLYAVGLQNSKYAATAKCCN